MEEQHTSGIAAETIFAVASGSTGGAVTIIRVSGGESRSAIMALSGADVPPDQHLVLRKFSDPVRGELLDIGMVVFFGAPRSFTGEDVAEFHLHGGRAVADAVLVALGGLAGLRPADPGEFTRRAFEYGKLDITSAEAIADLVEADTESQRRQALRQMEGGLARTYEAWRKRLVAAASQIEAEIDFSDEDVPTDLLDAAARDIDRLQAEIDRHLDDGRRGELVRGGVEIAILGAPNVGKSSLLNRIAHRDAAIVAQTAGTTRDVIEVQLNLGGYAVTLVDTAGLREAAGDGLALDPVEREGISRALAKAASADIKLVVFDAARLPTVCQQSVGLLGENDLAVFNKCDLLAGLDHSSIDSYMADQHGLGVRSVCLSATTGWGIDRLTQELTGMVADLMPMGDTAPLTKIRHRRALEDCVGALSRAKGAEAAELRAEDLRLALQAIGRVTGRIDVEEILDAIFSEFCIGK